MAETQLADPHPRPASDHTPNLTKHLLHSTHSLSYEQSCSAVRRGNAFHVGHQLVLATDEISGHSQGFQTMCPLAIPPESEATNPSSIWYELTQGVKIVRMIGAKQRFLFSLYFTEPGPQQSRRRNFPLGCPLFLVVRCRRCAKSCHNVVVLVAATSR